MKDKCYIKTIKAECPNPDCDGIANVVIEAYDTKKQKQILNTMLGYQCQYCNTSKKINKEEITICK